MTTLIELLAVIASATYGVLLARQHRMDFVGVFSVACIVAFGGGTLRDVLLDRHPLFWIREEHYPVIVFVLALGLSFLPRIPRRAEQALTLPDALGLGLFTVVGVNAALDSGTSLFVAALFGVITGTFGGVIGDVVCNRVPSLFGTAPLYATCSFGGAWLFLLLQFLEVSEAISLPVTIAAIVSLRLAAVRWGWSLPALMGMGESPVESPMKGAVEKAGPGDSGKSPPDPGKTGGENS